MTYKNKEDEKEYQHKWYLKNKEKVLNQQKNKKGKQIHSKAQRKYNKSNKAKKSFKKYYIKNKDKKITKAKLNKVFQFGNIDNNDFICAICGKQPIEKHHENYNLPYVFIPLCKEHHNMTTNNKWVI